jgi:uncharacterized protein YqcC (DUF446 family)
MISINYWWHRENNTILIINNWIHWTVLDDMKILLELGMGLKGRSSLYSIQSSLYTARTDDEVFAFNSVSYFLV